MLLPIVLEVASLAERHQVVRAVVRRIVVAVSCCEHYVRGADVRQGDQHLKASLRFWLSHLVSESKSLA